MNKEDDFSFGDIAKHFDTHIRSSIPDYETGLMPSCIGLSQRFIQPGTTVIDVGCSTGQTLASIRRANQTARPTADYIGIDIESRFKPHWDKWKEKNLRFEQRDARTFPFQGTSLVISQFFVQFISPADKLPLLTRIHDGLVEGGALIIAEKTLAETARLQDALTFPYYDRKLANGFSAKEILDKERRLRGQMTLYTDRELKNALEQAGFSEITSIWRSLMFVGILALKSRNVRRGFG
jgi:tRNA (cmo5U34)-methyltransferase